MLAVLVAGVPVGVVMIYQTLSVLFAQLTHANIKSPARLDRLLSVVFVTPNMHKVHHHYARPLTDSNYGNIFSIWDRIFRTFTEVNPNALQYGIDSHMEAKDHSALGNLLAIPFQTYRASSTSKFGKEK